MAIKQAKMKDHRSAKYLYKLPVKVRTRMGGYQGEGRHKDEASAILEPRHRVPHISGTMERHKYQSALAAQGCR